MDKLIYKKIYEDFNQYRADIFDKLNIGFEKGKSILDVGAGDCIDSQIFRDVFGLDVLATDLYESPRVATINIPFVISSIYELNKLNRKFDYIFLHDVLHHIDEQHQSRANHIKALESLGEVVKPGGLIIIVEGNRYNPLFFPHIVKLLGHNHFKQSYFNDILSTVFPTVEFRYFESHAYPPKLLSLFKIYETCMEKYSSNAYLSYNAAIVRQPRYLLENLLIQFFS